MDVLQFLPFISLFIGLLARVFVPWLAKRKADPENAKWNWEYVWPQILSFLLIIMVLPLVIDDFNMIQTMPSQAAWIVGWGAADLGREIYKTLPSE